MKPARRSYSSPPSPEKLDDATRRLAASNDALERKVGGLPLPAGVAVAVLDLSDEQRLAVCRELKLHGDSSAVLHLYEAEARARIARRTR